MSFFDARPSRTWLGALAIALVGCGSKFGASEDAPGSPNEEARIGAADQPPTDTAPAPTQTDSPPTPAALLPTNGDPSRQIRFTTSEEADARRATLVDYIWGGALPTALPAVTTDVAMPAGMTDVDPDDVARVDQLDVTISDTGLHALAYVLYPAHRPDESAAPRAAIIHQGHAWTFGEAGLGRAATHLLEEGLIVVAMHMPLHGWNSWGRDVYASHTAMFDGVPPAQVGRVYRPFLEPVVQTINWLVANVDALRDVSMLGVSGGGWTTAMSAAIDPRIAISMQVAGSAPLYVRNAVATDLGDREQWEPAMYAEDIAVDGTGGGVATWLEIDALGGYGAGRKSFQVINELDECCFAGPFPDAYAPIVSSTVFGLGAGSWSYVLDPGQTSHEIAEWALDNVLDVALTAE